MNMGRKTCRAQLHRSLRAQHRCAPTALLRPAAPRQRCFAPLLSEVEFLKEMPGRDERCSAFACAVAPPPPAQRPCASAQHRCAPTAPLRPLRAQHRCAPTAPLRPPQRPSALKNNWRRRGCRRQYTWLWGAATVGRGSVGRRSERYGKRGSPPTAFAQPDRSIDQHKYSTPMPQCGIEKRQF
jgi:hypothetical protein